MLTTLMIQEEGGWANADISLQMREGGSIHTPFLADIIFELLLMQNYSERKPVNHLLSFYIRLYW